MERDDPAGGPCPGPAANTDRGALGDMGRLLLEDVCSDLVRFLHSGGDPARFGAVRIDREWLLRPGAFADLRVEPDDEPPYFLEVKYGYDPATLLAHLQRKYGTPPGGGSRERVEAGETAKRLVLVVDRGAHPDWPALEGRLRNFMPPHLALEVWDEERVQELICACFGRTIPSFAGTELLTMREHIDQGKERIAFGDRRPAGYAEGLLRHNLLWHFGAWRLAELRHGHPGGNPGMLVPPRSYERVVVLIADLSGFSRYMRDSPDDAIVRQILTNFYAKSRYQIINGGGMLVQFVGDAVVALFGLPDHRPGYVEAAARTAFRLLDIGASVSHAWQRRIDHIQTGGGMHVSLAMGDVQLVSMRPMDHARLAAIGECMGISQRLLSLAGPNQIVVSNVLRHALQNTRYGFATLPPFEARNIGTLQPWRLLPCPEPMEAAG